MPTTVWSHNTIVCRAMNFTPFQLMYGIETMILEEIKHRSLRTATEIVPYPNEADERPTRVRQTQGCGKLEKIPGTEKSMERPKSQTAIIRSRKFGTSVKPQD
jgi:hypothetical protein